MARKILKTISLTPETAERIKKEKRKYGFNLSFFTETALKAHFKDIDDRRAKEAYKEEKEAMTDADQVIKDIADKTAAGVIPENI